MERGTFSTDLIAMVGTTHLAPVSLCVNPTHSSTLEQNTKLSFLKIMTQKPFREPRQLM